ncbi:MAG: acireductone synthase [Ancalomicrobiaceae bacterium]|nr:acireductone synthase [Ancalomicrobiaceae bacterium]
MTTQLTVEARAILLDIEGTIGPASFITHDLVDYARDRFDEFIATNRQSPAVRQILSETVKRSGRQDAVAMLKDWLVRDEKVQPLKELQSLIWQHGYADGTLQGRLFADAQSAIEIWHAERLPIYVYSSFSVKAQRLFFGHTEAGDLRHWFAGHFDTSIGAKVVARSYEKIAGEIRLRPQDVVYFADTSAELAAAVRAGVQVVQVAKETKSANSRYPVIDDFSLVDIRRPADRLGAAHFPPVGEART